MATIVAEIGCNHMGNVEPALEMITMAKNCGAHAAKFQKRTIRELFTDEQFNAPHPCPANAYGPTYGAHREALEFTALQHSSLKAKCEEVGILYCTSVWDVTSAKEIVALSPALIKVGSPSNLHFEMQKVLRDEYAGEVHISTGMSTPEEIERIVDFWEQSDQAKRVVLYACTSGYPVDFKDVCLLEIVRLQEAYKDRVKSIGFSGHHLGIAVDMGAVALGATWIERHFTKNRTFKGTDHSASLEEAGLRKLVRNAAALGDALRLKPASMLDVEVATRKKLKFQNEDNGPK